MCGVCSHTKTDNVKSYLNSNFSVCINFIINTYSII